MDIERLRRTSEKLDLALWDGQKDACLAYMHGKDVIFVAPTGYGKSIAFHLAPFLLSRTIPGGETPSATVIVVMPTNALIRDAISKVESRFTQMSITAVHLTRANLPAAYDATFVFCCPETLFDNSSGHILLTSPEFVSTVKAVFVDECHLLEDWGETDWETGLAFREEFSHLGRLRSILPDSVFVAMTATATKHTLKYVKDSLAMIRPTVVEVDINKKNISYHVIKMEEKRLGNFSWLVNLINREQHQTPRMLIFFNDTVTLTNTYQYLTHHTGQATGDNSPLIGMYSSLTSEERKTSVLTDMNRDSDLRVVLCTSSLSVGVNLASIKYCVHYGLPSTTNAFLQESGRAGREAGSVAASIVICYKRMLVGRRTTPAMKEFMATTECRRQPLLREYDSPAFTQLHDMPCCDNCGAQTPTFMSEQLADHSDVSSYTDSSNSSGSVGDIEAFDSSWSEFEDE